MGVMQPSSDILAGGFYTVPDVVRLLQMDSAKRVRGWLAGYAGTSAGPVIERDYDPVGGVHAVSFWDLMEIRFLEHFRRQNVPLQTLRKVAVNARREMSAKHPLALANTRFLTDRKEVFLMSAEETGDDFTLNLVKNQFEMYVAIESVLAKGVAFNPVSGLAESWQPLGKDCPHVVVNPMFAFGKPVIGEKTIPTRTLFSAWKAEDGDRARVGKRFGVSTKIVDEAVEFEVRLAAA